MIEQRGSRINIPPYIQSFPALSDTGPAAVAGTDVLDYANMVLSTASDDLICYWPLWDTDTTTADNYEGTSTRDGTFSNVTLEHTGIGDGKTSAYFNGTTADLLIFTTDLQNIIDLDNMTFMVWAKFDTDAWTDGNQHNLLQLQCNTETNTYHVVRKDTTNGRLSFYISWSGGSTHSYSHNDQSWEDWKQVATSCSTDGYVNYYLDGTQIASDNGTGTASDVLHSDRAYIGAAASANTPFKGYIAHAAIWNTVLADSDILYLASVP